MSADAIAVFNPKDPEKLKPFLDLDEESEESDGLYAEALADGAMLVHTFQPFEVFEQNPSEARAWLTQFGDALPDVHDDPRGLLFFPDSYEPAATTYDAVVGEMADKGIWIATGLVDDDDLAGDAGLPPIDMETLQAFAGQLLGSRPEGGAPATSFEVGKLFEDMQQQLLGALGMQDAVEGKPAGDDGSGVYDEEFEGEEEDENQAAPKKK